MARSTSQLQTYQGPIAVHSVEISVADTRVLDVDKNLIWAGLLNGNLLVVDGPTGLLDDLCPLLLWNFWHYDNVKFENLKDREKCLSNVVDCLIES